MSVFIAKDDTQNIDPNSEVKSEPLTKKNGADLANLNLVCLVHQLTNVTSKYL